MTKKVSIITDFHTHLLPDIDCSGKPEISAKLIEAMKTVGIKNIVLTPHFYPQRNNNVEDFILRRDQKIANLKEAVSDAGVTEIEFFNAAEVLLCPGLENLKDLDKLCIEGTNTILIEMPDLPWGEPIYETLGKIRKDLGLEVVIAHADRYGKKESMSLIEMGFKVQLNADSTASFSMKKMLLEWVKNGYVYALGSDKHVHSDKASYVYKDFPKADAVLSKFADMINERSLKLIGK